MQAIIAHLPVLLQMSGEASILIVLVLAAQWLLGRRLQPRWRCALWLLVLLRLALPWTVPSPASLFNVLKMPAAVRQAQQEMAPVRTMAVPISNAQAAAASAPSAGAHWLAWLWATGALLLAGFAAVSQYKFLRRVGRLRPLIDEPTLGLLEDCKALMGVATPVTLVETEAVPSPTLFGFLRPRLLLPAGLVSTFTREELRHVFLHELAHLKRRDILTGWATLVLQILHWFNPLVWLAFHRLRVDRELACDALALSYARTGENESYGLTIVKLLEGFGQGVWGPGLAGILEDKHQMKERIRMIAKFHKKDRGLALAVVLLAGLALVALTDAQNPAPTTPAQFRRPNASNGVWAVKFEPVGDFSPRTPGEFLGRIHIYSGQHGEIGYFRTTKQGGRLIGSFLASDPDQLKAALNNVPGLRVIAVEKLTPETLAAYEKSPQESLIDFSHPDASQGVWAVKFEPVGDFSPRTPGEFLGRIHIYSGQQGEIGYFRTARRGDKLIGSFLAYDPGQLKAALNQVPGLKVISVEKLTPETLAAYKKLPQQTLAHGTVPHIVATTPAAGATDVNPARTEITVTFDEDMGRGMSWTGGGPDFPPGRNGQRAYWRDQRTCVLPVTLEAGHYYRVGINSKSYRNFASVDGVAALPAAIYFTTRGASPHLKARTLPPQVVRFNPLNGARNVSPTVTELRVTFNVPMGGGCSWCTVGDTDSDFPKGVAGKRVYWTPDKKTCVLPVDLKPGMTYRISLNAPGYNNFQSDAGVPLKPVIYTFTTSATP